MKKGEGVKQRKISLRVISSVALLIVLVIVALFLLNKGNISQGSSESEQRIFDFSPVSNPSNLSSNLTNSTSVSSDSSGSSSGGSSSSGSFAGSSSETPQDNSSEKSSDSTCGYSDSDDGNSPFVKGSCDDGKAFINYDSCQDSNILKEFVLDANCTKCNAILVNCEILGWYGCSNGVCTAKKAQDSDGGDLKYVKGTCSDVNGTHVDVCSSKTGDTLTEYFVDPDSFEGSDANLYVCAKKLITCENGCSDGACIDVNEDDCSSTCAASRSYVYGDCVQYDYRGAFSKNATCINQDLIYGGSSYDSICSSGYLCCCGDSSNIA